MGKCVNKSVYAPILFSGILNKKLTGLVTRVALAPSEIPIELNGVMNVKGIVQ